MQRKLLVVVRCTHNSSIGFGGACQPHNNNSFVQGQVLRVHLIGVLSAW